MPALSKRKQVEALGWRFAPVPYFWAEGRLWHNSDDGKDSLHEFTQARQ